MGQGPDTCILHLPAQGGQILPKETLSSVCLSGRVCPVKGAASPCQLQVDTQVCGRGEQENDHRVILVGRDLKDHRVQPLT